MTHDKTLVKIVHRETVLRRGTTWTLSACLTRFGGLCVIVMNDHDEQIWQGDNIIEARDWMDSETL
jgi:hypothetical protein